MKLRQAQALAANPERMGWKRAVPARFPGLRQIIERTEEENQLNWIASADLNELSYSKLVTLNAEMEQLIQVYNESLVDELAHRDELEYEKEMKNTFISLLLSIQNKRRQFINERKRKGLIRSLQSCLTPNLEQYIEENRIRQVAVNSTEHGN
ncbi:FEZ-like protein [Teladorsagia circumcincta]|uniref:FEZ-like protein n=2 Tax=Teladorsagia circumcincta TaxID=45464 RepID=A0A2G9U9X1_TELCI|nr:FEZ-like protein [Teladorsagia circumcincta]